MDEELGKKDDDEKNADSDYDAELEQMLVKSDEINSEEPNRVSQKNIYKKAKIVKPYSGSPKFRHPGIGRTGGTNR